MDVGLAGRREAGRHGGALVVLDRRGELFPPAVVRLGIEPEQLVVVHAESAADNDWAMDQVLRSPAVAAVAVWPEKLDGRTFRRWQLAVEEGGGLGLLLRPASARSDPSWADVRLLVEPLPAAGRGFGWDGPSQSGCCGLFCSAVAEQRTAAAWTWSSTMRRILCIRLKKSRDCNLQSLVEHCGRFSPIVGPEPTDDQSLLLDITGLAHLFGGEAAMAEAIVRDFSQLGLSIRVAVADTIGAAWAITKGKAEGGRGREKWPVVSG